MNPLPTGLGLDTLVALATNRPTNITDWTADPQQCPGWNDPPETADNYWRKIWRYLILWELPNGYRVYCSVDGPPEYSLDIVDAHAAAAAYQLAHPAFTYDDTADANAICNAIITHHWPDGLPEQEAPQQ